MNLARPSLRNLDDALKELISFAQPLTDLESISTFEADGRVIAQDLVSEIQVPPNDNSSMDGYALRLADLQTSKIFPITQRIPAGGEAKPLDKGSVARIFTGATIPSGADVIVMQEDVEVLDSGLVRINGNPSLGQWIRKAGEDVQRGSVVLPKGARLNPASLGMAASIGCAKLIILRKPRVALFSTGDELVMPGDVAPRDMRVGAIYNSNRFFLRALLQRFGCVVTDLGIVPDRLNATVKVMAGAAENHDLILTSGGVSVGEEDHIKPAVNLLGELSSWSLAMKPGKPFAYGRIKKTHFIGLPGNPVSSFVTFLVLVRPFLLSLQGITYHKLQGQLLPANFDWLRPDKRREFLRVKSNSQGGLDLFPNQNSGVLTSIAWSDGWVDNPAGMTINRGDLVRYFSWPEVLG